MMQTRTLGTAKPLTVTAIGLGCMEMTPLYGTPNPADVEDTMSYAIGVDKCLLDTSDAYAAGKNEEVIAPYVSRNRNNIVLASKFGNVKKADGKPGANGRPEYVFEACEKSLKRLGVEVIDLYYQHRIDPDVPVEETVGAMSRLIEQGKVLNLGLSEAGPETIRRAHATHPITALQTEYSLFTRDVEDEILPTCRELGIGFVAYSPLGRGTLTGTISGPGDLAPDDRRHEHPRFQKENLANNVALVSPVKKLADAHGVTPAQVALAWLLSRGPDIVPIPGTSKRHHIQENNAAADITISQDALDQLGNEVRAAAVAGTRYPAVQMGTIGI